MPSQSDITSSIANNEIALKHVLCFNLQITENDTSLKLNNNNNNNNNVIV